jgi:osmotically-inducible protein OsmY
MAYDYDYDYERGRYGQGYSDVPHFRSYGYGTGGYYSEPYGIPYYRGGPYGSYDYGRYEYGPSPQQSYRARYMEPYYLSRYGRGGEERGFFERAGDEVRSWFGDEEAERRRRMDEMRSGQYVGRGPRGYKRSDERIREDVNDRLRDDPYLDATNIEVSVDDRVVTLTGTVDDREDKRRAEYLAESVSGVTDVINQLRVSPTGQTATETTGTARARAART